MPSNQRTLALDYGERRIGLALSDELGIIATGIGTLDNDDALLSKLLGIIEDRAVVQIVVGLPLTLSGMEGKTAKTVQAFAERLRASSRLPVHLLDERYTSSLAARAILDMGVGKKKRREKGKVDEIAAIILLQGFLDSARNAKR